MASGANNTFRQVGIATGIAVFGTLFTSRLATGLARDLDHTPLAAHSSQLAAAISGGTGSKAIAALPTPIRLQAAHAARSAFRTRHERDPGGQRRSRAPRRHRHHHPRTRQGLRDGPPRSRRPASRPRGDHDRRRYLMTMRSQSGPGKHRPFRACTTR